MSSQNIRKFHIFKMNRNNNTSRKMCQIKYQLDTIYYRYVTYITTGNHPSTISKSEAVHKRNKNLTTHDYKTKTFFASLTVA